MKKGDTKMEKKFNGAPGMVAPSYNVAPTMGMGKSSCCPSTGNMGPGQMGPYSGGPFSGGPSQVSPFSGGLFSGGPSQVSPFSGGPTQMGPTYVAPTQTLPAQVSPTQNVVQKNIMKHIVPHIHPTHTTTVNDHVFQHQHYFPQTCSVVNQCCNQHVICGPRPPRPYC